MTTETPAPAEALSREQLLTLLVQASEAAQNPGEEHEALAEQFMTAMSAPGTANVLRSILAALARAEAAEGVAQEVGAWYRSEPLPEIDHSLDSAFFMNPDDMTCGYLLAAAIKEARGVNNPYLMYFLARLARRAALAGGPS